MAASGRLCKCAQLGLDAELTGFLLVKRKSLVVKGLFVRGPTAHLHRLLFTGLLSHNNCPLVCQDKCYSVFSPNKEFVSKHVVSLSHLHSVLDHMCVKHTFIIYYVYKLHKCKNGFLFDGKCLFQQIEIVLEI